MNQKYTGISTLADVFGRPISIFDTETTGLGKRENTGIVDIACLTVHASGKIDRLETLINPGMKIPRGASEVHGIFDADVKGAPSFDSVAGYMRDVFSGHVISGFNSKRYDFPIVLLRIQASLGSANVNIQHLESSSVHFDVRDAWKVLSGTSKGKLVEVAQHYQVQVDVAHRAMADVLTTARVLEAMINIHGCHYIANCLLRTTPASNKPERPQTKSQLREQAIADYLRKHGHICADDYPAIAQIIGADVKSVSFGISEMFAGGRIEASAIWDRKIVDRVVAAFPQAMNAMRKDDYTSDGRIMLTPLRAELGRLLGIEVDFIQLRISIAELAKAESADKSKTAGMSMR